MNIRRICFNTLVLICFMFISSCVKHKKSAPSSIPQFQELKINNTDLSGGVFEFSSLNGDKYYFAFNNNSIFSSINQDVNNSWVTYNIASDNIPGKIVAIAPFYNGSTTVFNLIFLTDSDTNNLFICKNVAQYSMNCQLVNQEVPEQIKSVGLKYFVGNNGINYAETESMDEIKLYTNYDSQSHTYEFKDITPLAAVKNVQTVYDINVNNDGVAYFLVPADINDRSDLWEYNPLQEGAIGGWTHLAVNDLISKPIAADIKGNVFYVNEIGAEPDCSNNLWNIKLGYVNNAIDRAIQVKLPAVCSAPISIEKMTIDSNSNIYITVEQNAFEKVYKVNIAV